MPIPINGWLIRYIFPKDLTRISPRNSYLWLDKVSSNRRKHPIKIREYRKTKDLKLLLCLENLSLRV